MKKLIKTLFLIFVISIPLWVLFDNIILKKIIISTLEKATKKEVELDAVKINYFPNLNLELHGIKIPNPMQDNYLITAKKILINIDTEALLQKSLIINTIESNDAIILDPNNPPEFIASNLITTEKSKGIMASEIFKKSLKKSLGMFNESESKSNVTEF